MNKTVKVLAAVLALSFSSAGIFATAQADDMKMGMKKDHMMMKHHCHMHKHCHVMHHHMMMKKM